MADLSAIASSYAPDAGAVLELTGPDGAPLFNDDGTAMTLTLLGNDADAVVKYNNKVTNRRLAQRTGMKLTSESLYADGTGLLATATTAWNITLGGEKPTLTFEAAAKLYSDPKLAFVRAQASEFMDERAHFSKASPTA